MTATPTRTRGCSCASAFPFFFVSQNAMPAEAAGGDGVLQLEGTVCWQWQEGGRGERINGRVRGAALATS